jgi:predicted transcriptional regulator
MFRLQVDIPEELREKLKELAEQEYRTMQGVVIMALHQYIEKGLKK